MKNFIASLVAVVVVAFAGLLALGGLAACTTTPAGHAQKTVDSDLRAAWVVIGEDGQATARVITAARVCPALTQDGVRAPMHERAAAAIVAQRPVAQGSATMSSDKPATFDVLTCEMPLQPHVASLSVAGRKLPVPTAQPLKILLLGDTGCRLKAQGNYFQLCDDPTHWAFGTVAAKAATFAPDLVVHVGDYQYRENPCPADIAACADSPWGYGWDTWQADFFTPAAPLLAVAPWVMARGNHESCQRAGQGWWRFLDPRPLLAGRDCNLAAQDQQGDFSAPYAVPLGGGSQLIMFDSSKVPGKALNPADPIYATYAAQFREVDRLAQQASFSMLVEHHPILGFAPVKGKVDAVEVKISEPAMQSVLKDLHPQRLFDPHVQLLLAGHVHLFEAITFSTDHPMQIVSGNGGSSPDVDLPATLPAQTTPFAGAVIDHFNSTSRSGFMTMERSAVTSSVWTIRSWDQFGQLMTTCVVSRDSKTCS